MRRVSPSVLRKVQKELVRDKENLRLRASDHNVPWPRVTVSRSGKRMMSLFSLVRTAKRVAKKMAIMDPEFVLTHFA